MPTAPSTSYSPQIPRASPSLTVVMRKSLMEKKAVKRLRPNKKKEEILKVKFQRKNLA